MPCDSTRDVLEKAKLCRQSKDKWLPGGGDRGRMERRGTGESLGSEAAPYDAITVESCGLWLTLGDTDVSILVRGS